MLKHPPLHLNVITGMSPIPLGVHISHVETILQPRINPAKTTGDLSGHKCLTTPGALVIEKHTVTGIHPVRLSVIHCDPVGIQLGDPVGTARIEGG